MEVVRQIWSELDVEDFLFIMRMNQAADELALVDDAYDEDPESDLPDSPVQCS